jgi:tetratricopeptide (TPR) repeat protein
MIKALTLVVAGPVAILLAACAASKPVMGEDHTAAATASEPAKATLSEDVLYDILLGEIAQQRGQYEIAIQSLSAAAEKTHDPRLAEEATLTATQAKRYQDALKSAELWVQLEPRSQAAQETIAGTYMELGQTAEAERHFEQMLAIAGSERDRAYRRIASVLGRQQNRTAAIDMMRTLVSHDAKNPSAQFALAHLAVRTGDLDAAGEAVSEALKLRPDWEEAALFKAGVLVSQKDNVKAQAFYEDYLAKHAGATRMRLSYARYLVDLKQWDKARGEFLRVLQQSPDDAETAYAVGLLSLQTNHLDEADKYLKQALKLQPDLEQARVYLGEVAEERKDYAAAARWYREVPEGEYYFEAQTRLGVIMAKQGDVEGARRHLQAIQAQTDAQRVQLFLAEEQVLRDAKRYNQAMAVLDDGLKQIPGDKDLLYARALIAEKQNRIDVTERDLRAILAQDGDNAQALNALGYTLADRTDRYQEALKLIERALALKPDDPFILDSMGWVQYRLGNNAEAIKYLKRALAARNDAEISAHLGEVLWVTGDRTQARSVWQKALENTPDNEVLHGTIKKFLP